MLEQVLQRAAVLQQLERVKGELSRPRDLRRQVAAPALPSIAIDGKQIELTDDDLRDATEELAKAEARESAISSGQPGFEPVANRRGDTAQSLDDVVFLSREPAIGLLQSALEQYHLDEKPATVVTSTRRAVTISIFAKFSQASIRRGRGNRKAPPPTPVTPVSRARVRLLF